MSPVDDDLLERKVRTLLASRSGDVGPEPALLEGVRGAARRLRVRRRAGTAAVTAVALAVAAVVGLGAGGRQSLAPVPPAGTGPAHDGLPYDWPVRGALAGDADARAAALDIVSTGSYSHPHLLWMGRVAGGYAALVRVVDHGQLYVWTEFSRGRIAAGNWAFFGSSGLVHELGDHALLAALLSAPSDVEGTRMLLVLGAPGEISSAQYATAATVGGGGKIRRDWRAVTPRDGVVQVDELSKDQLLDLTVRLHLSSGETVETMPGNADGGVTLAGPWLGQRRRPGVPDPVREWLARHGVPSSEGWFERVWSDRLPDGTPAALDVASVGRYAWAAFGAGKGQLAADVRLPDAQSADDYAGPPEMSAYLPTSGSHPCALVVVVPRSVTRVRLDGSALPLDHGAAMVSTDRCSGGQLTVRTKGGRTTYRGPVDTDR
ncbi:MAG: hypothetical protein ACJ74O_19585 [Frankiaceae bacterium]